MFSPGCEYPGQHGHQALRARPLVSDVSETGYTEDVTTEVAHAAWADAARDLLIRTARRYHHVITVKELAAGAQERTELTATQRTHHWIGDVAELGVDRVVQEVRRRTAVPAG